MSKTLNEIIKLLNRATPEELAIVYRFAFRLVKGKRGD